MRAFIHPGIDACAVRHGTIRHRGMPVRGRPSCRRPGVREPSASPSSFHAFAGAVAGCHCGTAGGGGAHTASDADAGARRPGTAETAEEGGGAEGRAGSADRRPGGAPGGSLPAAGKCPARRNCCSVRVSASRFSPAPDPNAGAVAVRCRSTSRSVCGPAPPCMTAASGARGAPSAWASIAAVSGGPGSAGRRPPHCGFRRFDKRLETREGSAFRHRRRALCRRRRQLRIATGAALHATRECGA